MWEITCRDVIGFILFWTTLVPIVLGLRDPNYRYTAPVTYTYQLPGISYLNETTFVDGRDDRTAVVKFRGAETREKNYGPTEYRPQSYGPYLTSGEYRTSPDYRGPSYRQPYRSSPETYSNQAPYNSSSDEGPVPRRLPSRLPPRYGDRDDVPPYDDRGRYDTSRNSVNHNDYDQKPDRYHARNNDQYDPGYLDDRDSGEDDYSGDRDNGRYNGSYGSGSKPYGRDRNGYDDSDNGPSSGNYSSGRSPYGRERNDYGKDRDDFYSNRPDRQRGRYRPDGDDGYSDDYPDRYSGDRYNVNSEPSSGSRYRLPESYDSYYDRGYNGNRERDTGYGSRSEPDDNDGSNRYSDGPRGSRYSDGDSYGQNRQPDYDREYPDRGRGRDYDDDYGPGRFRGSDNSDSPYRNGPYGNDRDYKEGDRAGNRLSFSNISPGYDDDHGHDRNDYSGSRGRGGLGGSDRPYGSNGSYSNYRSRGDSDPSYNSQSNHRYRQEVQNYGSPFGTGPYGVSDQGPPGGQYPSPPVPAVNGTYGLGGLLSYGGYNHTGGAGILGEYEEAVRRPFLVPNIEPMENAPYDLTAAAGYDGPYGGGWKGRMKPVTTTTMAASTNIAKTTTTDSGDGEDDTDSPSSNSDTDVKHPAISLFSSLFSAFAALPQNPQPEPVGAF